MCYGLNPKQGIFKDSLFVQPDLGFSWIIPGGWETINKPSMVAAYEQKGKAIVAMRILDNKKSIHELGEEAKGKTQQANGVTIESARDTLINSFPGYVIRMKSVEEDQVMISELIWLTYQNVVLQLVGVCSPVLKKEIHQSLCGFRKAKREELQQINLYELQLVHARANETIEKLTDRVGNRLSLAMTAVINRPTNKTSFNEGELVKIVKGSPYQPKH